MTQKRIKTAQVNLRIEPSLKDAAEKAAAADHRSLTGLVEKLLSDYLRKKGYLGEHVGGSSAPHRPKDGARKSAPELASRDIDQLGDQSATAEERASRKRRLIRGPTEFRHIRRDQPKAKS